MLRYLPILMLIWVALARPAPASDRCDAAATLARVHDHYHAILNEDDLIQTRSAAQIFNLTPSLSASTLAAKLSTDDVTIDADRLQRILKAVNRLSRDLITRGTLTMVELAPHRLNVDWLARTINASDCVESFAQAPVPTVKPGSASGAAPKAAQRGGGGLTLDLGLLIAAAGLIALGALTYIATKSRAYRIMQADRLPRHMTTVKLDISFETPIRGAQTVSVTGLDVSAGGMKLAWPDAPPQGTTITASLPTGEKAGSVVWSNAHYAGVVFDQQLAQDEVDVILS